MNLSQVREARKLPLAKPPLSRQVGEGGHQKADDNSAQYLHREGVYVYPVVATFRQVDRNGTYTRCFLVPYALGDREADCPPTLAELRGRERIQEPRAALLEPDRSAALVARSTTKLPQSARPLRAPYPGGASPRGAARGRFAIARYPPLPGERERIVSPPAIGGPVCGRSG
jgi:hypothetical protein